MKSLISFFIFVAAGFAGGYGAAKWRALELLSDRFVEQKEKGRLGEFCPTQYPLENLPFCIVIIGKNNGASVEKTLQSAFSQRYENFRIVYVDDGSDDGSAELARDLIYGSPEAKKVQYQSNDHSLGFLATLARVVRGCPDFEIVVVLNGEDWLSSEWVLTKLNQYYADPDLWITYGQSRDYPTYQLGNARPLFESGKPLRSMPFASSHPKTFYAGLFKKIEEADFRYKGEYFQAGCDLAYMLPMLEMAQGHSQCLSDILYICNREAVRGEDREQAAFFEKYIRSLKAYSQLPSLEVETVQEERL